MTETILWFGPVLGLFVHWALGRYNSRKVERDWEEFRRLRDERSLETLSSMVEIDHETIDFDLRAARVARQAGRQEDAIRLLRLSQDIIEDLTPDRLERLRAMTTMIRMAVAVTPVEPVAAAPFKTVRLGAFTSVARLLHSLVVTPAERFVFRVSVISAGFRIALRLLRGAADEITTGARAIRAWRTFENGAEDWKTLDREHLDTARAFLSSFSLRPRPTPAVSRAR